MDLSNCRAQSRFVPANTLTQSLSLFPNLPLCLSVSLFTLTPAFLCHTVHGLQHFYFLFFILSFKIIWKNNQPRISSHSSSVYMYFFFMQINPQQCGSLHSSGSLPVVRNTHLNRFAVTGNQPCFPPLLGHVLCTVFGKSHILILDKSVQSESTHLCCD